MTGPNRQVIRRRLDHAIAFITGKAYVRKADVAESPLGWSLSRGLHRTPPSAPIPPHSYPLTPTNTSASTACAQNYLPEYGPNFQVHVQTPFKKLNLYTATLTILGEDEPLLQTKFCPTPVDALSNLRIMIMVCEDPGAEERLAELREAMGGKDKGGEQEHAHDPFNDRDNSDPFRKKSDHGSSDSQQTANQDREDAMIAELDLLAKEKLAREQWDFTVAHLAGKKSRHATSRRKERAQVSAEDSERIVGLS
jgi:hypothetical protein